jgi:hypothetical protein
MRVVIGEKRHRVVGLHLPKALPLDGGGFQGEARCWNNVHSNDTWKELNLPD